MYEDHVVTLDEWVDLLSIATRFDFERIRERAIREIGSRRHHVSDSPSGALRRIDPVDKIVLAELYDVPQWLKPSYAALCQRANPLEDCEGEKLGLKTALRIARAREAVRESPSRHPSPSGASTIDSDSEDSEPEYAPYSASLVARVVQEVFWPEPATVSE
jgi:hypothetical protein